VDWQFVTNSSREELMSDNAGGVPQGSGSFIRSPREFYGGLLLAGVAVFALWASRVHGGLRGFAFGPGTAPALFAYILLALGAAIAVVGLTTDGPAIDRFHLRGPLFVTLSVLIFAVSVRSLGLAISSFLSICAAAGATPDAKPIETAVWAVFLTAFCCFLFPYALNLPMQLWPISTDPLVLLKSLSFR
jgi:putative tricarboxylic transport membrane protein